jgi:hypothetical protein
MRNIVDHPLTAEEACEILDNMHNAYLANQTEVPFGDMTPFALEKVKTYITANKEVFEASARIR